VATIYQVAEMQKWWIEPKIQSETNSNNDVKIQGDIYGNCSTPVDEFLYSEFLQTIAYEWLHVQQGGFERMITIRKLYDQINKNAINISELILDEFIKKRKIIPQDSCKCSQ
jgi:hypothetical protein